MRWVCPTSLKLDTYELIYSGNASENLAYQFSTFFSIKRRYCLGLEELAAAPNGTLTTIGLEVEAIKKRT